MLFYIHNFQLSSLSLLAHEFTSHLVLLQLCVDCKGFYRKHNFFLREWLFIDESLYPSCSLIWRLILEGFATPSWHTRAQTQMGCAVASDVINQHLLHSLYEAIGLYWLIYTAVRHSVLYFLLLR